MFLPEKARAIFEIPSLKGMPNPSNMHNLFDVRIPRLFIPKDEGIETDPGFIILNVISGATQTELEIATMNVFDEPDGFTPHFFTDVTPRQLMEKYLEHSEDSYVFVDRYEHRINFHRPEPWRVRFDNWWRANAPDWLQ